ncbi:MAG: hypothetical protein M3P51_14810, partial [Chloroflexota bacterium]|nr:hypothetical protein [Chloroflexota bacterium]
VRKSALRTLDAFVQQLEVAAPERRSEWVHAFCRAIWDRGVPEPVQQPLLVRVILPELRRGYEAQRTPYARWIAQFRQEIWGSWRQSLGALGFSEFWAEDLLREALRLDPHDSLARRELISVLESALDYYIHEVPSGVLAEPHTFRQELAEFEQLVAIEGLTDRYERALGEWRFHCEEWARYLEQRDQFLDYEEYLSRSVRSGRKRTPRRTPGCGHGSPDEHPGATK